MGDAWISDETLITFDGTVLEAFGAAEFRAPSVRWHVRNLRLSIDEPDRHGRRLLKVAAASYPQLGEWRLQVEPDRWPAVEPVLRDVQAHLVPLPD